MYSFCIRCIVVRQKHAVRFRKNITQHSQSKHTAGFQVEVQGLLDLSTCPPICPVGTFQLPILPSQRKCYKLLPGRWLCASVSYPDMDDIVPVFDDSRWWLLCQQLLPSCAYFIATKGANVHLYLTARLLTKQGYLMSLEWGQAGKTQLSLKKITMALYCSGFCLCYTVCSIKQDVFVQNIITNQCGFFYINKW